MKVDRLLDEDVVGGQRSEVSNPVIRLSELPEHKKCASSFSVSCKTWQYFFMLQMNERRATSEKRKENTERKSPSKQKQSELIHLFYAIHI